MRKLSSLVLIALCLSLTLIGVASARPAAANATVNIQNFAFNPQSVTINVGETVTWTNSDTAPHTATSSGAGTWTSGRIDPGQSATVTFNEAGTFTYICEFHGNMSGTVVVQSAQAPAPTATPAPTTAPSGPTPMVEASNQPIDGSSVTVAKVVAAQDGWIVIHTNTADNKPGPVIGQTAVKAGENMNVKVALSATPAVGDKLWPMLHIDAGTMGTYEFPGADVPVSVNGAIVMVQITVTAAAATPMVEASNQPIVNNGVTVAKVVAAQDGWIVIHTNTADNKPGPVIGQAAVKAGENMNVKVALSATPAVGDKLWPMLHIDAGTMGTYEFPGADVPVSVNGAIVMVQITVTSAPAQLPVTGETELPALWLVALLAGLLVAAGLLLRRRIA